MKTEEDSFFSVINIFREIRYWIYEMRTSFMKKGIIQEHKGALQTEIINSIKKFKRKAEN